MIRAVYNKAEASLTVDGHAHAGRQGEDLVCAAVSAFMLAMQESCPGCVHPGFARFRGGDEAAYRVIWKGLQRLEREYPAYIRCREKGEA